MTRTLFIQALVLSVVLLSVPQLSLATQKKEKADIIHISISKDGFLPTKMTVGARWNPEGAALSETRPMEIIKEPKYEGKRQNYGSFKLGNRIDNVYYFVLDEISDSQQVLYFDVNNNKDLTDDEDGPIFSRVGPMFATVIKIPFKQLIKGIKWEEDFNIWIFQNEYHKKHGQMAHNSQTELKGMLKIGGREYTAYLSDFGVNDANLTNDGISIDIDGNGKIDYEKEHFFRGDLVRIADRKYKFEIEW